MVITNPEFPSITNVCIVENASKRPIGHTIVAKTKDTQECADLWKDGLFSKKTRYICFSTKPEDGKPNQMIQAMQVVYDKDSIPNGFVALHETLDSNQKALKKKLICIKYAQLTDNVESIVDIIILSKSGSAPLGHDIIGEISGLHIAVKKISALTRLSPQLQYGLTPGIVPNSGNNPLSSAMNVYPNLANSFSNLNTGPSALKNGNTSNGTYPTNCYSPSVNSTSNYSTLSSQYYVLDWVPFRLRDDLVNVPATNGGMFKSSANCNITVKSPVEIDSEYSYEFSRERQVLRTGGA